METVNALVKVNIARLNWPTDTLNVRRLAAFRALIVDVPADVSGLFLRLIARNGSFTDYPAVCCPDLGKWRITVPAAAFMEVGRIDYEIHAEADDGEPVALGRGVCDVRPFTAGSIAPAANVPFICAKMPVKGGGWVNCWATMDETGEYTYEFEDVTPSEGELEEI